MEKNDKAVEIYTYGLKVLPSDLPASSVRLTSGYYSMRYTYPGIDNHAVEG